MDNKLSIIIGERINTLLAKRNVKQKELAKMIGVPDNTISYFCSGKRIPNTQQIKCIADYFDVSADYLLGISSSPTKNKDIKEICDFTGLSEKAVQKLNKFNEATQGGFFHSVTHNLNLLNEFIESEVLFNMLAYIDDYNFYAGLQNEISKKLLECDENEVHTKLEEFWKYQKEMDICLFRIQEYGKDFTKKHCEKTLNEIKNMREAFLNRFYAVIKKKDGDTDVNNP